MMSIRDVQKIEQRTLVRGIVWGAILFFILDLGYKTINHISYLNRENCILYKMMPKLGFLVFEYFVELFLVVVVGIFLAVLLETYFSKYKRFYPANVVTAFLYASLLPVCACTSIPLVSSMRTKLKFRTIITFVVAAPLLSPYIVLLSFTVLGVTYGILRIVGAFILAASCGYLLELFFTGKETDGLFLLPVVNHCDCDPYQNDIYIKTYGVLKKVMPYLLLAGVLGIGVEYAAPAGFLSNHQISNSVLDVLLVIFVGIPVYFCNGAEVLVLRPLIHQSGLFMGSAVAFSLASTAICTTSFFMLMEFLGKKLTFILTTGLILITAGLGIFINSILPFIPMY